MSVKTNTTGHNTMPTLCTKVPKNITSLPPINSATIALVIKKPANTKKTTSFLLFKFILLYLKKFLCKYKYKLNHFAKCNMVEVYTIHYQAGVVKCRAE